MHFFFLISIVFDYLIPDIRFKNPRFAPGIVKFIWQGIIRHIKEILFFTSLDRGIATQGAIEAGGPRHT